MNSLTKIAEAKKSNGDSNFITRAAESSEEKKEGKNDNPAEEAGEYKLPEHLHPKNRKDAGAKNDLLEQHLAEAEKIEGRYNGTVNFEGGQVKVRGGFAHVNGEVFMVSDDGRVVADKDKNFVGTIQNGKFIQATPELIDQFKQAGLLGNTNEQPQGMAAQSQG